MSNLKKLSPATFLLPQEDGMRVPGLVFANEETVVEGDINKPLDQVRNVAHLPGIVGYSIAMPDMHWGYGFPIGGVAATRYEDGVISPGGVGYDINCGVRLALVKVPFQTISKKQRDDLLKEIYHYVPSGVGHTQPNKCALNMSDFKEIEQKGMRYCIERGFGFPEDLENCENNGFLPGADLDAVSETAIHRGRLQLGTIGSGNHFVELGEIEEIMLPEIAKAWGIEKGMTYLLIHSGSRGFGHQICEDTLREFAKKGYGHDLPDRQLIAAPISSPEGKKYFAAMNMAANYAFCNRQMILHAVRKAIHKVLHIEEREVRLLYDVCHNIAKIETHPFDGKMMKLCVHRKGATRAFGPGSEELPPHFRKTGQPVLVPGDMLRGSFILQGNSELKSWCSACHGAGRAKSRVQTAKNWQGKNTVKHMEEQGVQVKAESPKTIAEEMPDAYRNVSHVVQATQDAGLANIVARLKPFLVLKG